MRHPNNWAGLFAGIVLSAAVILLMLAYADPDLDHGLINPQQPVAACQHHDMIELTDTAGHVVAFMVTRIAAVTPNHGEYDNANAILSTADGRRYGVRQSVRDVTAAITAAECGS